MWNSKKQTVSGHSHHRIEGNEEKGWRLSPRYVERTNEAGVMGVRERPKKTLITHATGLSYPKWSYYGKPCNAKLACDATLVPFRPIFVTTRTIFGWSPVPVGAERYVFGLLVAILRQPPPEVCTGRYNGYWGSCCGKDDFRHVRSSCNVLR